MKKLSFLLVVALLLSLLCGCTPKFELLADGSLYCADPEEIIEIPRKYDGTAVALDGDYSWSNFKYDGELRHFLKFYNWLTESRYCEKGRYIYCNDYTLYIVSNDGSDGGVDLYYDSEGMMYLGHPRYIVSAGDEEVCSFEYYSDLWDWVN